MDRRSRRCRARDRRPLAARSSGSTRRRFHNGTRRSAMKHS